MIIDKVVVLKWNGNNRRIYESLGYKYTKLNDKFTVNIEDVKPGASVEVNIKCDYCGKNDKKNFKHLKNKEINFCSKECVDQYKKGRPLKEVKSVSVLPCDFCHQKFEISNWRIQNYKHHFCSKTCADKFRVGKKSKLNMRVIVPCHFCNTEFEIKKYRLERYKRNFCSRDCMIKWWDSDEGKSVREEEVIAKNKAKMIEVNCKYCTKEIIKKAYSVKRNKKNYFCDNKCHRAYMKKFNSEFNRNANKAKFNVKCYNCNKEKQVVESVYKKNKFFFCSHECYQKRRIEISDIKHTETSIHQKINKVLEDIGVDYKNEYGIKYYSVDIYLSKFNLIIEIMGDYWHANPIKYPHVDKLNSVQIKDIRLDKRKQMYIQKYRGINVLYLWETDIKNNQELCKNLIIEYINNNGILTDYHSYNYCLHENKLKLRENIIKPHFVKEIKSSA